EFFEGNVDRARQVLVLVPGGRQYLDQLGPLGEQPPHLVAVGRHRHHASASTSPKTARPASEASRIEITAPRTSGCSASQRSALAAEAKKFSTGQQPRQASPWSRNAPATTTADVGDHSQAPSGSTRARIASPLIGSRDSTSTGSPNIGAVPSASRAHI